MHFTEEGLSESEIAGLTAPQKVIQVSAIPYSYEGRTVEAQWERLGSWCPSRRSKW